MKVFKRYYDLPAFALDVLCKHGNSPPVLHVFGHTWLVKVALVLVGLALGCSVKSGKVGAKIRSWI